MTVAQQSLTVTLITLQVTLFDHAQKFIPGGVNSPVRAFRSVGGTPRFFTKAKGAYLWDADENRYVDTICSWGPAIVGHARKEVIDAVKKALLRIIYIMLNYSYSDLGEMPFIRCRVISVAFLLCLLSS